MGRNTELADVVEAVTPDNSTVLVVSGGDEGLIDLPARQGRHFPPADGDGAAPAGSQSDEDLLTQLEELRRRGAGFLALPPAAFGWLQRYPRFAQTLETAHGGLIARTDAGMVFDLGGADEPKPAAARITPHEYRMLVARVRGVIAAVVPAGATVLVVSKGDETLIDIPDRRGWHFPRDEDGRYAGYYPEDDAEAVAHLEDLRGLGAGFIAFPASALWWLERYRLFAETLERRFTQVAKTAACAVFDLRAPREAVPEPGERGETGEGDEDGGDPLLRRVLGGLLPEDARVAVLSSDPGDLAGLSEYDPVHVAAAGPRDAIAGIRDAAATGTRFVVIPRSAFDWLERSFELTAYLEASGRFVTRQRHACEVWELPTPAPGSAAPSRANGSRVPASRRVLEVVRLWWKQRGNRGEDA